MINKFLSIMGAVYLVSMVFVPWVHGEEQPQRQEGYPTGEALNFLEERFGDVFRFTGTKERIAELRALDPYMPRIGDQISNPQFAYVYLRLQGTTLGQIAARGDGNLLQGAVNLLRERGVELPANQRMTSLANIVQETTAGYARGMKEWQVVPGYSSTTNPVFTQGTEDLDLRADVSGGASARDQLVQTVDTENRVLRELRKEVARVTAEIVANAVEMAQAAATQAQSGQQAAEGQAAQGTQTQSAPATSDENLENGGILATI